MRNFGSFFQRAGRTVAVSIALVLATSSLALAVVAGMEHEGLENEEVGQEIYAQEYLREHSDATGTNPPDLAEGRPTRRPDAGRRILASRESKSIPGCRHGHPMDADRAESPADRFGPDLPRQRSRCRDGH